VQALSDDQQIERLESRMDRLEKKVEDGFVGTRRELRSEILAARSDGRSDFRPLIGVQLAMFLTMILGFAGIVAGIFLQHL
jgi:hypothetical protein